MTVTSIPLGEPNVGRSSLTGPPTAEALRTRAAKMADAGWSMRMERECLVNPEYHQYHDQFVAVYDLMIVASGEDYSEVLHRAAAECQVPISRIIVSFWGEPTTWLALGEIENVTLAEAINGKSTLTATAARSKIDTGSHEADADGRGVVVKAERVWGVGR